MQKRKIEEKKEISKLRNRVERIAKPEFCLLCGKKTETLCNSHTVPQFILKEIAEDGMVCYGQSLNKESDFLQTTTGIKNAFTFKLICRDCDKKAFADYEAYESIFDYENLPNSKKNAILIEIAIKTHLSHINTKNKLQTLNLVVYPQQMEELREIGGCTAYEIDIEEHLEYIRTLTKARKRNSFAFEILFDKVLDYKVGIATQALVPYIYDCNGNKLFDPHDFRTTLLSKYFYVAIFPYKDKTRIWFYIEKKNVFAVKTIIDYFNDLTEEEKLHFIFISLMLYDEQVYINPKLNEQILSDKALVKLYRNTDVIMRNNNIFKEIKNFRKYNNYLLPMK